MDPISATALTSTCLAITRNAVGFVTELNDAVERARELDIDLAAITARAGVLRLAADHLRAWLETNGSRLRRSERAVVRDSLQACDLLVASLRRVTGRTRRRERNRNFVQKLLFVAFSQPRLNRYSNALNDQILALNTILQAVNLNATSAKQKTLEGEETQSVLQSAIHSASTASSEVSALSQSVDSDDEGDGDGDGQLETASTTGSLDSGFYGSEAGPPLTQENLHAFTATIKSRTPSLLSENMGKDRNIPIRSTRERVASFAGSARSTATRSSASRSVTSQSTTSLLEGEVNALFQRRTSEPDRRRRRRRKAEDTAARANRAATPAATPAATARRPLRTRNAGDGDPGHDSSSSSGSQGTARPGRANSPRPRGHGTSSNNPDDSDDGASIAGSVTTVSSIHERLREMHASVVSPSIAGDDDESNATSPPLDPSAILQELFRLIQEYRAVCDDTSSIRSTRLSSLDDEIQRLIDEIQRFLGQTTHAPPRRTALVEDTNTLHHAARKLDLRGIRRLIARGADVNARDTRGTTTPLLAVKYTSPKNAVGEIVTALIAAGANVHERVRGGGNLTALHLAASSGSLSGVEALLCAPGIDVQALDSQNRPATGLLAGLRNNNTPQLTPLHFAIKYLSPMSADIVAALLEAGASANAALTMRTGVVERPIDMALVSLERAEWDIVSARNEGAGIPKRSVLYERCVRLGTALQVVDQLLANITVIRLSRGSMARDLPRRRLYAFQNWYNSIQEGQPIPDIRVRLKARRAEMVLLGSKELHVQTCLFHDALD
ncbi:hypothetical protein B0H63DRAFT_485422 [Podospora didyma]|uniref:Ankyrin repeat protein n=1 Tax=Podospora didyma TaxID=330526 RepID=A0AAE0N7U6_9PEZI|nr:hypothetical protein B0H63DRAFT_485422 [Podospora didyma]